ncbi:MAG: ABC transporter ATP-binding protein, partial [Tepidiformaceae bacterium]
MDQQDEAPERPYDAALLRRLLRYALPYRRDVALAVALLMAGGLLALVGPWLTQRALDVAIPRRDGGMLVLLTAAFLGALLVEFVQEYASTLVTTRIGQRVMLDLRAQLFERLQRLSISYFDRNPVGRLITRVTSDVETLNELFSSGLVALFGDFFTLAAIMVAMLVMDWRLALVAFTVVPLIWIIAVMFRRRIRDAFRDIRGKVARLNAFLQEHLSGMRVVQLFGREEEAARRFDAVNRDHLGAHLRSITIYAVFLPIG